MERQEDNDNQLQSGVFFCANASIFIKLYQSKNAFYWFWGGIARRSVGRMGGMMDARKAAENEKRN